MDYDFMQKIKEYVDISGVIYVVLNNLGKIELVNSTTMQLLGYSNEELIGKDWFDMAIPSDLRNEMREVYSKIMKGEMEGVDYYENEIITRNGEKKIIAWKNKLRRDEEGKIIGSLSAGEDVSEKLRERDNLSKNLEKLQMILEKSLDGILMADIDTKKFVYANLAVCKMFGYEKSEFENIRVDDIHPKDKLAGVIEVFEAQARGEVALANEIPCLRKDGKVFFADINTIAVEIDNRRFNVGFFRSMTDQRNLKKMYENVIENSNQVFYIHDNNHVVSYVSSYCREMFGYTEEEMKKNWFDFTTDNPINIEGKNKTEKAMQTGEEQGSYNLELRKKDGSVFMAQVREKPLKDKHGLVVGMTGSLTDITNIVKYEGELAKLLSGLEHVEDVVFSTDINGDIEYVNSAFVKTYGYEREEVLGNNPRLLKSGKQDNNFYSDFWKTITTGDNFSGDLINKTKKDEEVVLMVTVGPIKTTEGEIRGYIAVQKNVTEARKTETIMKEKMEELGKLNNLMVNRELRMIELKEEIKSIRSRFSTQKVKK